MEKGGIDDVFDGEGEANNVLHPKDDSYDSLTVVEDQNTAGQGSREDSYNPDVLGDSNDSYDAARTGPEITVINTGSFRSGAVGASVRFSDTLGEPSSDFPLSAVGSDVMRLVDQNSDNPGLFRGPASGRSSAADGAASGLGGPESITGEEPDSGLAAASDRNGSSASLDRQIVNSQETKRSATSTAGGSGGGDEASGKAEAADSQSSDVGRQPAIDGPGNDSGNKIAAAASTVFDTVAEMAGPADMSAPGEEVANDVRTGATVGLNAATDPAEAGAGRWEELDEDTQQGIPSSSSGAAASERALIMNGGADAGTETGSLGAGASHSPSNDSRRLTAAMAGSTLEPVAPIAAERSLNAGPETGEAPTGRGGARRHSYVSPQYDQIDRSASSLSAESRPAAGDGADGKSITPSATSSVAAQRLTDSAAGERSFSNGSSQKPWPSNSARRSSAAGISDASHRSNGLLRLYSEAAAPGQASGDGGASGEGMGVMEDMRDQTSGRQSATASSGGGGGSSSGRQGSVSYAWRGSSGGGESGGAAASRPGSSDSPQPRFTAASRSASFASETSNATRRISGSYAAQSLDDGGGGGLAAAMVSAAPSLPTLGSQPDDRYAAPPHSAPGDARRQTSQGGAFTGGPNPLPPLPSSSSSVIGATERSKPRSVISAPPGDVRTSAGGTLASAAYGSTTAPRGSRWPPPPTHLMPTHVQPKGPFDECTVQAAMQHVRTVWSTSNICGIRSLPNALSPDFRDRLYEELVQATHRDQSFMAPSHKPQLSYGLEGGPVGMPLSVGQKQVARINPLAGMFTQFEYLPSEYDRMKLTGKYDRLKHKLAQTSPQEFVVRATPVVPHGAPAFSEFTYTADPVDSYSASMHADTDLGRSKVMAGPFYPSGRVSASKVLKGRLDECMMRLCKHLSDDWPNSFLQVFEDRNGSVVASFHMASAVQEGDLSAYMNTLCKRNHLVATYQLIKDATRWGLVDEGSGAVFYVMWPPWVRHRYLGPHTAPPVNEVPNGRPGTRGSNSSEEEEDGDIGGGEDLGMGLATDLGDGGQNAALGYGNQPLDSFAATGSIRRTGVFQHGDQECRRF